MFKKNNNNLELENTFSHPKVKFMMKIKALTKYELRASSFFKINVIHNLK